MEGPIIEYHGIENDVKFVEIARFSADEHKKKEVYSFYILLHYVLLNLAWNIHVWNVVYGSSS